MEKIRIIGAAFGKGSWKKGCEEGPFLLKTHSIEKSIRENGFEVAWQNIVHSRNDHGIKPSEAIDMVAAHCRKLCAEVSSTIDEKHFPLVFGGDHSVAVGTWSGIITSLKAEGRFGLIWFDAHMDSHDEITSESGLIHGMPLAALLGEGNTKLTHIGSEKVKLAPENVTIIGVRSFQKGEQKRLERLGVKIFYIDEVIKKGFKKAFEVAVQRATKGTKGFGISIDLDGFDPEVAPAVGTPEKGGMKKDVIKSFTGLINNKKLKAVEITEYNPHFEKQGKTFKIISFLLKNIFKKRGGKISKKAAKLIKKKSRVVKKTVQKKIVKKKALRKKR